MKPVFSNLLFFGIGFFTAVLAVDRFWPRANPAEFSLPEVEVAQLSSTNTDTHQIKPSKSPVSQQRTIDLLIELERSIPIVIDLDLTAEFFDNPLLSDLLSLTHSERSHLIQTTQKLKSAVDSRILAKLSEADLKDDSLTVSGDSAGQAIRQVWESDLLQTLGDERYQVLQSVRWFESAVEKQFLGFGELDQVFKFRDVSSEDKIGEKFEIVNAFTAAYKTFELPKDTPDQKEIQEIAYISETRPISPRAEVIQAITDLFHLKRLPPNSEIENFQ